ncbi:hypothetical protein AAIE21_12075 [Paenibacillus sp. 102]|uniref:hypothetical protein n=1 Tax=Paenibacillus sp. 102 TaxID=3120823 RepID=UPI0031B9E644
MIRTVTFVLAIVLMGYTVYSWGDGSKQSMLITQLLLGCMVVGIGLQTYRRNENENKLVGIICLAVAILYICSLVKIF